MQLLEGRFVKDNENNEYLIEKFIGNGAFGNVFKIRRISDDTEWALKTIAQGFTDEQNLIAFKNEINLATKIDDSNVIKYLFANDGDTISNLPPYVIMEYANKGTLKEYIKSQKLENKFLDEGKLKNLFLQLAKGMKAVNSVLVHRDIKPDNILIKDDVIKISDFGLSKISTDRTRTITFKGFGHLMYTAPEGWKNDKNTIQMDIYSMGLVFYELATLQFPYNVTIPNDVEQWKNHHLFSEPVNPSRINTNLSPVLSGVIMKMLEKSTTKRFNNWEEIESYLINNDIEEKEFSSIINAMINNRLAKDNSESKKKLEEERKRKEDEDFCKLVEYQFKKDIYNPIQEFIDTFNKAYPQGEITITPEGRISRYESIEVKINLISKKVIDIKLKPILEKDFIRKVTRREFGEEYTRVELQLPTCRGRKIKAWGGLYIDKKGFNILLVQDGEELYGEWFILENTNSGLVQSNRPDPFAFDFNEIEKGVQQINVMSRYNSNIEEFNIEKFMNYISMYNM
ncbi:TPA: serine/threonine protein kinase [Clostridioides difficile]|nr:serine/threonine protein kinase [Clostridioides difficile]